MSKTHISDLSLEPALQLARSAGQSGDAELFSEAFLRASNIAAEITCNEERLSRQWKTVLKFHLESSNVSSALETMRRVEEAGWSDESVEELFPPVRKFLCENEHLLVASKSIVYAASASQHPKVVTDCIIFCWFRMLIRKLVPAVEAFDARDIWIGITSEAIRIATDRGLRVVLIPDYLVSLVQAESRFTLSFHTEGKRPGLTHYKPADLPGYAIIDSGGYSGWSSLAEAPFSSLDIPEPEEAERFFVHHKDQIVTQNVSKFNQSSIRAATDLPNCLVFVALQVANDRTQSLARIPMLEMLDMVVERYQSTPIEVVVKRHPKCKSEEVAERLKYLSASGSIVLRDDSIHTLIANSLAVFTVNSGVGSEAIVHLKPIYLFGEADYNCVAHRIANKEDFQRLTKTLSPRLTEMEMKQFLCYYRTRYLVRVDNPPQLREALAQRVFGPPV